MAPFSCLKCALQVFDIATYFDPPVYCLPIRLLVKASMKKSAGFGVWAHMLMVCLLAGGLGVSSAQAARLKSADVKQRAGTHVRAVAKAPTARRSVSSPAFKASTPVRRAASNVRAKTVDSVVRINRPIAASYGSLAGLHQTADSLGLKSNAVMVLDQQTNEVLFDKNAQAVLPIASITKLMTGLLIAEAKLPMDEVITITDDDVDTLKGSSSRLAVGTSLTRGELLHLALMSSENRAAHALGRTYPGGLSKFVELMNARAHQIGMSSTHYVDPTGLSPQNQSSAKDLAALANVAYERPVIRELSTSPSREVDVGRRTLQYRNSNMLVNNPHWDIGLQKTGYIAEAGRCLVMQANIAGRKLIMVFLDSAGKFTRIADAERVRRWVEGG